MFNNKVLLITGGTGSFGNAVLKRFLNSNVGEIRIFSRDEKKQEDMRLSIKNKKVKFYIGDVRDKRSVDSAMKDVDYIFHAAALKQVPSCEFYPMEAVKTNIIGAENIIDSAVSHSVKKIIFLSTDKAVYPINAMGMTKALMEKVMTAKSREISNSGPVLCATRYGNVMASRGSVIPLFINQIEKELPITITDPDMTRFLMSLNEAVELVLYAFKYGNQGDLFVQKSPASTIADLAVALKHIFKSDTKIKIIGTRHGEKLYETLVTREEMFRAEESEKYFKIEADVRDLNYEKFFTKGEAKSSKIVDYNSHNTKRLKVQELEKLLLELPEIQEQIR